MSLESPSFEVCLRFRGKVETLLVESSDSLAVFINTVLGVFGIPIQEKILRISYKDLDGDIIDVTDQIDWVCAFELVSEKRAESKQYILRIDIEMQDGQLSSGINNQHDFIGNQQGQDQENFNVNTIFADYSEKNCSGEPSMGEAEDKDKNDSWQLLSSQHENCNQVSESIELLKSKAESITNDLMKLKEIEKQNNDQRMKSIVNRLKTNISSQMDANAFGCHSNFVSRDNFEIPPSREEFNFLQLQGNILARLENHVEKSFGNIKDYFTQVAYIAIRNEVQSLLKSEDVKEASIGGNSHQLEGFSELILEIPQKEYKPLITVIDPKVTLEVMQGNYKNPTVYFRIETDTEVDLKIYELGLSVLHPTSSIKASINLPDEFLLPGQISTMELEIDQNYPINELANISQGQVNFAVSICLIHRITKSVICLISPNIIEIEFVFINTELNSLIQAVRLEFGLSPDEYPDKKIQDALALTNNDRAKAFELLVD